MERFVPTPQRVFDMFMVLLSFKWAGPSRIEGCSSTMSTMLWAMEGLDLITETQHRYLERDPTLQRLIQRHTERIHALPRFTPSQLAKMRDEERHEAEEQARAENFIAQGTTLLVIPVNHSRVTVNRANLSKSTRLFMTVKGKAYADVKMQEFAHLVTREKYEAEMARRKAMFASIGARHREGREARIAEQLATMDKKKGEE